MKKASAMAAILRKERHPVTNDSQGASLTLTCRSEDARLLPN